MAFYNSWSKLVLITLFSLGLSSCANKEEKKETTQPNIVEEQSGKETYNNRCATCHGKKGDLGISGAADLTKSIMTLEEKIYIITKGSESGVMTPFEGHLSEKEIDAVAKYTEELKK